MNQPEPFNPELFAPQLTISEEEYLNDPLNRAIIALSHLLQAETDLTPEERFVPLPALQTRVAENHHREAARLICLCDQPARAGTCRGGWSAIRGVDRRRRSQSGTSGNKRRK